MTKSLWQPPQLRASEGEERHATWLELFFDLVFVVAIAQLGHNLSADVSLWGFWGFAALFAPVWWCWVGATFYATRFDTDDLSHRLLTLLQMAIVAVIAVNIHDAFTQSSISFALSYAAFRAVLVLQYLNAGFHIPSARPLIRHYVKGFSLGIAIWVASTLLPLPWRLAAWILGLVVDFATPLTAGRFVAQIPPSFSHIPERLGLFVMIVLGESILAVVQGISGQTWTIASALSGFLGLSIAFSLWWIYFDTVDGSPLRRMKDGNMVIGLTWLYAHLPLAIGLSATGIGVEHVIKNAGKVLPESDRWLLCSGVILCLVALALIHYITCTIGGRHKKWVNYRLGSAAFVLVLAWIGRGLPAIWLVGWIALACAMQVALGLLESRQSEG